MNFYILPFLVSLVSAQYYYYPYTNQYNFISGDSPSRAAPRPPFRRPPPPGRFVASPVVNGPPQNPENHGVLLGAAIGAQVAAQLG
ncbi:unnamed protein product [Bursaphelenchus xylophilus]|uniref:(pine wood nematode) hypothetical protein n=1 Tax=Bursaphelenchus xylophilus TaxID=6326 RepID=A0A7I8WTG3_BURXY|nr:unnamed protein product [Bursaphelenchus xylophilus]CAG9116048.1 unnamed protein product [Bursaphelenchus xylophilus]